MTPLESLLVGRDERAAVQKELLYSGTFLCQVATNIPGWPKRAPHDDTRTREVVFALQRKYTTVPLEKRTLINGAGYCVFILFAGDGAEAKRVKFAAVEIEETLLFGRVFDIDIITPERIISRFALGLQPRHCYLCDKDAKVCARERTHHQKELREFVKKLLLG